MAKTIKNYFYEKLEEKFGLDLVKTIPASEIGAKDGTNSGPSRPMGLLKIVQEYNFNETDIVLDIGCGKGASMIALSFFTPCRVIDGIEYSKPITEICRNNLLKLNFKNSSSFVYNSDAVVFSMFSNYNVFYMYDPFRGDTFKKVINKIVDTQYQKEITLIYANPYEHDYLIEKGFVLYQKIENTDFHFTTVNIYKKTL